MKYRIKVIIAINTNHKRIGILLCSSFGLIPVTGNFDFKDIRKYLALGVYSKKSTFHYETSINNWKWHKRFYKHAVHFQTVIVEA